MAKILHLGNIANNAYNNAKYLNIYGPHQHTALSYDNPHVMACPEWEEIDTFEKIDEYNPNWSNFDVTIPDWYTYIETSELKSDGSTNRGLNPQSRITISRRQFAYWLKDLGVKKTSDGFSLPATFFAKLKTFCVLPAYAVLDIAHRFFLAKEHKTLGDKNNYCGYQLYANKLALQTKQVDLIEAYGADIIIPYIQNRPFIAYEHGTLRDLPFDGTPRGNLLSKAYQSAQYTIITNPDVIESAKKLGLKRTVFIPHAVDCERFKPNKTPTLRNKFNLQDKFIIVAPARQNWEIKGNNKFVEAFAKFLPHHPNSKLFICDWGQHRDLTKQLVDRLNLKNHVQFYSPCPKLSSVHYYQMADVVVDQFEAGAFGGITPEAMACEKPVLTYFNRAVHEWCFTSQPPLVNVSTIDEIAKALLELAADKSRREKLGVEGRQWVLQEYSITQLVERHNQVYDAVFPLIQN